MKELLVEPIRSVPPSPGVDAAVVLAEAVAARTRGKLRDGALFLLAIVFVITTPIRLTLGWVLLAVLISLPRAATRQGLAARILQSKAYLVFVGLIAAAYLIFTFFYIFASLGASSLGGGLFGMPLIGMFIAVVILVILASDQLVIWSLLTERFRRSTAGSGSAGELRDIHQFSPRRFLQNLERYRTPEGGRDAAVTGVPLVVYRGYSPFVGAGTEYKPWSTALPLERLPDQPTDDESGGSKSTPTLSTSAFYERIREEMTKLVRATPLTPGRRMRELKVFEQVIVYARELVDHLDEGDAATALLDPHGAPRSGLPLEWAQHIKADPQEWARYYLCFQVETWDRDLVVSVYVNVAVDEGTLYVEWTPCLLFPIDRQYQNIDSLPTGKRTPLTQAVVEFIGLPVSMLGRIARLLTIFRPLPETRDPRRYGSLHSLREMAVDRNVHNYFQRADVERYAKILDSRFITAVSRIMREFGYSSTEFEQQVTSVVTNNVSYSGNFNAPVVVGSRISGDVSGGGTLNTGTAASKPST